MNKMAEKLKVPMTAAILKLVSIVAPVFLLSQKRQESPLFPWLRSGIEGFSWLSLLLLFFSGLLLGKHFSLKPLFVGACSVAFFPLFTFMEMLADPTSHNLFPFEFMFYGFMGLVTATGVYVEHVRQMRV